MSKIRVVCQFCKNDDITLMEPITVKLYLCNCCAKVFKAIGENCVNEAIGEGDNHNSGDPEAVPQSDYPGGYPRCHSDT